MSLFDCDELLGKLKVRAQLPVSAGTWTNARLLEAMSDEAETWLMPLLIRAKGEFLVKTQDIACVAAQADYRFNSRAAGIREVSRLLATGQVVPLEEMGPAQLTSMGAIQNVQGTPQYYTFKEGVITLYPVPGTGTTDSLRVKYHYRLNRMAVAADTTTISAIVGNTLTVGAVPSAMGSGANVKMDFIRATPIFDVIAFDQVPNSFSVSATSLVFAAGVPTDLAVGDRVALARYTPFPNMPPELHICAALRAGSAAVASKGDKSLATSLMKEAEGKELSLLSGILEPRSKGNSHRLVSRRFR